MFYFPARHDHYAVQAGDGYAAHIAGVARPCRRTCKAHGGAVDGIGTVPHAAIAAYGGDTALAAGKFAEHLPDSVQLVVLVDFENDSVKTALEVARALGPRLYGVRLDTSGTLVDKSVIPAMGQFDPRGVNPQLVVQRSQGSRRRRVRIGADRRVGRFRRGQDPFFEAALGVPVDAYGVGSSLVANRGDFDFTADIVLTDGKPSAKVGRTHKPNPGWRR